MHAVLCLVIMMILPSPAAGGERNTINIIYTGGLEGELEPCGCSPKTDFGGVARLSGYLNEHANELSPRVLVDAGNFTAKDTPQGRLKAGAMLRSFDLMKYDAVAFSDNEKAFPQDFFHSVAESVRVPFVSDASSERRSILIRRDKLDIKISAVSGDIRKGSLNILLTDMPVSRARLVRGWDVIIVSSGEILEEPVDSNGTIIAAGYPKGRKAGILKLETGNNGRVRGFTHMWQPLGSDIREDADVRSVLNEYDANVAGLLKAYERPVNGSSYIGAAGCAQCHQLFEESWMGTRHASAFSSLQRTGRSADPECLVCHTVGYGEKGGFFSRETTPGLANVQCEECHGPGREHAVDFSVPMKPVTVTVCLKCHTGDRSPDFDYPVYYETIKH